MITCDICQGFDHKAKILRARRLSHWQNTQSDRAPSVTVIDKLVKQVPMPQHLLLSVVTCFFSAEIESEDEIDPHQATPERPDSPHGSPREDDSHHRPSESNSVPDFYAFLSAIDSRFKEREDALF